MCNILCKIKNFIDIPQMDIHTFPQKQHQDLCIWLMNGSDG